jgi:hypothetical protein
MIFTQILTAVIFAATATFFANAAEANGTSHSAIVMDGKNITLMSELDKRATYRNNIIYFTSASTTIQTLGARLFVEDYRITSGQDPDGRNRNLTWVQSFGGNAFNFVVGRKGSSDVASFFNSKIKTYENTFNQNASELNFAFCGSLWLTITGFRGAGPREWGVRDVCFAQGHTGFANNWWFGTVRGIYNGGNEVGTFIADTVPILFKRGGVGNNVNVIEYRFL